MATLGAFLPAGLSCIIIFTLVSCTLGKNIQDEILQRLEKIEEFNSNLKMESSNLKSDIIKIKRENSELVETVNKMKSDNFKEYNKIDEFNSDFKKENSKFRLELANLRNDIDDVRRENRELRDMVNEMNVWMRSGQFLENNDSNARIKTEREPALRMALQVANKGQIERRIRSSQRISKFIICLEKNVFIFPETTFKSIILILC